ncbi:MAG: hypothetical protein K2X86_06425 [Cytophagaceae bacterium]|nr:hypothetical protein [Cytophagaceae bacterium]
MKIFIFLFIIPFLLSTSCKKEKERPVYYMDQEFKNYTLFPVGSYWVYENSASGMEDSIYLYWQEYKVYEPNNFNFNFEGFKQTLSSSYYQDTITGGGDAFDKKNKGYDTFAERYISNFLVVNIQFFSPASVKDTFNYNESMRTVYETYYDSLLVEGVWFKEVRLFNNLYQEASSQPKYIYYSKNVGVIRKELFNGQIWNLKRYHIN